MRIGHGFDVHGFTEGANLILGGVSIPYVKAFKAHSDGDVLLHALCDALLGAVALGDIGQHFPDSDRKWQDCSSLVLLREVYAKVQALGFVLENCDLTVIAQAPKLLEYKQAMQRNIAQELNAELNRVNIKATTTEGLGYLGRSEGIACHAVVLLSSSHAALSK